MDGEGAKDLDDAVSVRKTDSGYLLGVHIADVSEYVRERTPLDRCAMSRGTSVYFVDKVVPMLPPDLSNGACSLNAGEEKYALSALISLDNEGNIINTELCESVIKSSVRGVYSEVNRLLSGEDDENLRKKYAVVLPSLEIMRELYEKLYARRETAGYIDFDTDDAVILINSEGTPVGVERRVRGLSERMIEQFMLCANEAVATLLHEKISPAFTESTRHRPRINSRHSQTSLTLSDLMRRL
jgi:ribonuclease R